MVDKVDSAVITAVSLVWEHITGLNLLVLFASLFCLCMVRKVYREANRKI